MIPEIVCRFCAYVCCMIVANETQTGDFRDTARVREKNAYVHQTGGDEIQTAFPHGRARSIY